MQKLIDDIGIGFVILTVIIVLYAIVGGGGSGGSNSSQSSQPVQNSRPVPTKSRDEYTPQKSNNRLLNKPDFYTDGTKDPNES